MYRDTFAVSEVLGSGVVGTPPQTLTKEMARSTRTNVVCTKGPNGNLWPNAQEGLAVLHAYVVLELFSVKGSPE